MKSLLLFLFVSFTMFGQTYKFNLAKNFEIKNIHNTFSSIVYVSTENQSYFLYLVPNQGIAVLYDFNRKVSLSYDLKPAKNGFQKLIYTTKQILPRPRKRRNQNTVQFIENDSLTSSMTIKFQNSDYDFKVGEKLDFKTYLPFSLTEAQNIWTNWSDKFKSWDLPFEPVIESWTHYSSTGKELSSKRLVSSEKINVILEEGNR